jgi:hypothetical protein
MERTFTTRTDLVVILVEQAQAMARELEAVSDPAPHGIDESVARLSPAKMSIHCVVLANGAVGDGLRKIAADPGSRYVARGW